jgi:DNA-directed RNA polymerase specialized sigma24 family protein
LRKLIRDQVRLKKFPVLAQGAGDALDVRAMASFLPSHESSPESRRLVRERTEQVKEALDALSLNQSRVCLLRFFEGMYLDESCAPARVAAALKSAGGAGGVGVLGGQLRG